MNTLTSSFLFRLLVLGIFLAAATECRADVTTGSVSNMYQGGGGGGVTNICTTPEGNTIPSGGMMNSTTNPCILYICTNGILQTINMSTNCAPVQCSNPYVVPGTCCPVCGVPPVSPPPYTSTTTGQSVSSVCVTPEGNTIPSGGMMNSTTNPCILYICTNGVITAINMSTNCPPVQCSNPYVVSGTCCPVCGLTTDCILPEGTTIPSGSTVISSSNPCISYTCSSGSLFTAIIDCGPLDCGNLEPEYIQGKCCPVCPNVTTTSVCQTPEGTELSEGQSTTSTSNPCTLYSCSNGVLTTLSISCSIPDCGGATPILVPGVCCPVCPSENITGGSCVLPNTVVIPNFATFTSISDPCRFFACGNGIATSIVIDCPAITCSGNTLPVNISGKCCSICPGLVPPSPLPTPTSDNITTTIVIDALQNTVPLCSSSGGYATLKLSPICYTLDYYIVHTLATEISANIHGFNILGQEAPVIHPLPVGFVKTGTWDFSSLSNRDQIVTNLQSGLGYISIRSSQYPFGELRGQIYWGLGPL